MRTEDEEAFDAFVRARGEYFLRVSVLLTGSVPEGEDLLQSSLVRLYRAWQWLDVRVDIQSSITQRDASSAEVNRSRDPAVSQGDVRRWLTH